MNLLTRKPKDTYAAAVIGAGAWGTALAHSMARAGHKVLLWDRDESVAQDILQTGENRRRHPGIALASGVTPTSTLAQCTAEADVLLIALPSEHNEAMAEKLAPLLKKNHTLVVTSKGFREKDGAFLTTLWQEKMAKGSNIAVLTGPTFAREMMEEKITTMLVASPHAPTRAKLAMLLESPFVRLYESDDIIGAQIGGALKNVLAIGSGIVDGLEMGNNARAALLTRGLVEIGRYIQAKGGEPQTAYGLAGMGDLLLTATSQLSRNYRFGYLVGKGTPVTEARLKTGTVEGILAARITTLQAQTLGIDLAIISAIDGILHGDVTPLQVIDYLMQRPRQKEFI
ncbi:MAG: glycerol-3-phosphate dehydrogenase [Alphaproteobacteria bacterium CG_4_10_14_0_8_um_filter_53_9]|nr:MAG: glycerol-3-phosphate dehydrogenase [Alphaproteobacteria bacterium CG_4_10_14_0_8_um_filter_53_9]